jgi:D-alanine-D-alanine ligase
MTPLSLVPEQAAHCGIPYADLVEMLVAEALRVHSLKQKGGSSGTADQA